MPTGQMVGAAFAGWFNDRVGRRGGMYVFTVCYLVVSGDLAEHYPWLTILCARERSWKSPPRMSGVGQVPRSFLALLKA